MPSIAGGQAAARLGDGKGPAREGTAGAAVGWLQEADLRGLVPRSPDTGRVPLSLGAGLAGAGASGFEVRSGPRVRASNSAFRSIAGRPPLGVARLRI